MDPWISSRNIVNQCISMWFQVGFKGFENLLKGCDFMGIAWDWMVRVPPKQRWNNNKTGELFILFCVECLFEVILMVEQLIIIARRVISRDIQHIWKDHLESRARGNKWIFKALKSFSWVFVYCFSVQKLVGLKRVDSWSWSVSLGSSLRGKWIELLAVMWI